MDHQRKSRVLFPQGLPYCPCAGEDGSELLPIRMGQNWSQQVTKFNKTLWPTCQVLCQWAGYTLASVCRLLSGGAQVLPLCLQFLFFTAAGVLQGEPFGSGRREWVATLLAPLDQV